MKKLEKISNLVLPRLIFAGVLILACASLGQTVQKLEQCASPAITAAAQSVKGLVDQALEEQSLPKMKDLLNAVAAVKGVGLDAVICAVGVVLGDLAEPNALAALSPDALASRQAKITRARSYLADYKISPTVAAKP